MDQILKLLTEIGISVMETAEIRTYDTENITQRTGHREHDTENMTQRT